MGHVHMIRYLRHDGKDTETKANNQQETHSEST